MATDAENSDADSGVRVSANHLVILIHGINTRALWMGEIKPALERSGFTVGPTSYGKFGVPRFLLPFPWLRNKAISRVVSDIRTARKSHKLLTGSEPEHMSLISHSFGTYVVSKILSDYPDFQWHRIIFCGSVVREDFRFDQVLEQFYHPLLNEIGTKDYWPALAESIGWGYGSVGSTGFNRPPVESRWHNGFRHSDFLTESFCRKYWIPFLRGDKPKAADKPTELPFWIRAITWLPLRWVLLVILIFVPLSVADVIWNRLQDQRPSAQTAEVQRKPPEQASRQTAEVQRKPPEQASAQTAEVQRKPPEQASTQTAEMQRKPPEQSSAQTAEVQRKPPEQAPTQPTAPQRNDPLDIFAGIWVSVEPAGEILSFARGGLGWEVSLSIGAAAVRVSDGRYGSNLALSGQTFSCYYFVSIISPLDMTWLFSGGDGVCLPSMHLKKDVPSKDLESTQPKDTYELDARLVGAWIQLPASASGSVLLEAINRL
jgi:pimeloyl-ACP methyl ester carboxylesterase